MSYDHGPKVGITSGHHQWIWSINIYKPYIMWIVHRWPSKIVGKWRLLRVRYAIGVLCLMAEMPRRIYPILSMLKQHGILRAGYLFYLCILYTSVYICIPCLFLEIWRGSSRSVDISWLGELPNQLPQPCQWRTYLGGANRAMMESLPHGRLIRVPTNLIPCTKIQLASTNVDKHLYI